MKKQLLSIFATLAASVAVAQIPSPSWTISQNASFSVTSAGHRFLDAVDANVVWLSGYDGQNASLNYNWFSRTINGGTSYNSGNIFPDTNNYQLGNMEGIDANIAWVAAFQRSAPYSPTNQGGGVIYQTTNGGATWNNMTAPGMFTNTATSFCNWVSFLTPNVGIVNGDPVNGEFELWRTTNGGTSWTQVPGSSIPNPTAGEFCIVNLYSKFGSSNLWFGTNAGRVYRTTDAGVTWSVSALPTAPNATVTELAFSSASNGVVLAATSTTVQMYNTTDGGATWNLIHNNLQTNAASLNIGRNDLCEIPGTGYLASVDNANGTLSYSKNNGLTWIDWGSTGIGYVCIDFANSYRGWAGSFSDATNPAVGGIWKFNGLDFNSSFTLPANICSGAGNVTVSPVNNSNGLPPTTYSWSALPSGVVFSSATATVPVITFSANGTYTVILEVINPDGVSTSSQVVNVLTCAAPVAGFSLSSSGCNNVAMTLTNTSTGAPNPSVVITSSPSTNFTVTQGSNSLFSLKFGDPGSYVVTMTATNNAGTSTYSQSVVIADCRPALSFTIENAACRVNDTLYTNNSSTGILTHTWSISPQGAVTMVPFAPTTGTLTNRRIIFTAATATLSTYTLTLRATNGSGTTSVSQVIQVTQDNCVGISENTNLGRNLSVYPNPAHEQINVMLTGSLAPVKIKLTNLLGALIYEEKANFSSKEKLSINVANNPKGIYFLTVESNNEKVTKKIVIE